MKIITRSAHSVRQDDSRSSKLTLEVGVRFDSFMQCIYMSYVRRDTSLLWRSTFRIIPFKPVRKREREREYERAAGSAGAGAGRSSLARLSTF